MLDKMILGVYIKTKIFEMMVTKVSIKTKLAEFYIKKIMCSSCTESLEIGREREIRRERNIYFICFVCNSLPPSEIEASSSSFW